MLELVPVTMGGACAGSLSPPTVALRRALGGLDRRVALCGAKRGLAASPPLAKPGATASQTHVAFPVVRRESIRADVRRIVEQEVARAAGSVIRIGRLADWRSLCEAGLLRIRARGAQAGAMAGAAAASDSFRQALTWSAAGASIASSAAEYATPVTAIAGYAHARRARAVAQQ